VVYFFIKTIEKKEEQKMNKTYLTKSYEETQKLGEKFAHDLSGGDVVLLFGDLGAGKTTFMQGLAKGLGVKKRIISPTFIIMRTYEVGLPSQGVLSENKEDSHTGSDIEKLYHIDLYRTETIKDIEGLGFFDILQDKKAIIAIEWPEKLGEHLPKGAWVVKCSYIDDTTRQIIITKRD